jgi:hypothetical protein
VYRFRSGRLVVKKWEYDSIWERIVTKGKDGIQEVVVDLTGDPDKLRVMGPVLVERLNKLREANAD